MIVKVELGDNYPRKRLDEYVQYNKDSIFQNPGLGINVNPSKKTTINAVWPTI